MDDVFLDIIRFIRKVYGTQGVIPLHEPRFIGNEKEYVAGVIDSTFVSSVAGKVEEFEKAVAKYTGSRYAVAVVNGTAALHLAMILAGVRSGDEVITQSLTFVATANAIRYTGANPVFIDISEKTLSLDPEKLEFFLKKNSTVKLENGKKVCYNRLTGRRIVACVPVHTFGHPALIDELMQICDQYGIAVIEDAAESLGSLYKGKHTGTLGLMGVLSFNGNKIITTGSGGMILTQDKDIAIRAKHLSTQAKINHQWEYIHDEVGYNYRMTGLQAALGLAQMENVDYFVRRKRALFYQYKEFFDKIKDVEIFEEPQFARSNYWLNVILLENLKFRDNFLKLSHTQGIMTRPAWRPLHLLDIYKDCQRMDLTVTEQYYSRMVCLPSSVVV